MNELYSATHRLVLATADMDYSLEVFGDHLAEREGYKAHKGLEAICFYLVQKFRWLPRDVKSMSKEDIHFVMAEEMSGWRLPKEALPSK